MAAGRLLETGHQAQAGGLAGTGRPEHGKELAVRDVKIDRIDGFDGTEMARDVFEQDGGGHGISVALALFAPNGAAPHLPAGILSPRKRGEERWTQCSAPLTRSFAGTE